jgi:hypothetical protein
VRADLAALPRDPRSVFRPRFVAASLVTVVRQADLNVVRVDASNPDGSVWVGMDIAGPGLGLQQLSQGAWKPFANSELDGSTLKVQALFEDRENALRIGTATKGIYRIEGRTVDHIYTADGLSSDSVYWFYEDREGSCPRNIAPPRCNSRLTAGLQHCGKILRSRCYVTRENHSATSVDAGHPPLEW